MKNSILRLLVGTAALSIIFTSSAFAEYTDLKSTHKYAPAVYFITAEGIVNGYKDGTFRPENTLNRAEMLKIAIEANYDKEFEAFADENCFADVKAGDWFTPYVCFAKDIGLINGYSDNTFRPGNEVNFVEALKIVVESYKFSYDRSSTPWYKDLVDSASVANIIPLDVHLFDQKLNRGQMADMVTRMIYFKNQSLADYLGYKVNCKVSYESLEQEYNIESNCIDPEGSTTVPPTDGGNTSGTDVPAVTIKFAYFESSPYAFKSKYPANYYFKGFAGTETGVLRKYIFGPGIEDPNATTETPSTTEPTTEPPEEPAAVDFPYDVEEKIALEVLGSGFQMPVGISQSLNLGAYKAEKFTIDGRIEIYFTTLGKSFRVKGSVDLNDILINIAASVEAI